MSPHAFNDAAAYEHYMGRWSRAAASAVLDWMAPPAGARWLDVGCGTGAFTERILDTCFPATVNAIDPSQAQISYARRQPFGQRADFRVASAEALPFPEGIFDLIVSALVIAFVSDRPKALAEMRRVGRPGGIVAAYVWDSAAELAPNWPLRLALRQVGANVPPAAGTDHSSLGALYSLFQQVGLEAIAIKSFDVTVAHVDFDDFWRGQMARVNSTTEMTTALSEGDRAKLIEYLRARLAEGPAGSVAYSARVSAIKGYVPV